MRAIACLVLLLCFPSRGAGEPSPAQQPPSPAQPEATLEQAQQALAVKDYARAVTLLEQYLAEHPGHLGAQFNLAYGYSLLGRATEAIAAYQKSLALDPKLFQAYLNVGLLLLQEGATAEAAKMLAQAISLRPEHSGAQVAYGEALLRTEQIKEARALYEAVLAREPANAEAQLGLAQVELADQAWPAAEKRLRHILEQGASRAEVRSLLAEALLGLNQQEAAAQELEAYLKARPQDAARQLRLGRLYRELGRHEDALRHLDQAQALGQSLREVQTVRAETLAALEHWEEAAALYQQLLADEPGNADLHLGLGIARLHQSQAQAAVEALLEAVRLQPDSVEAYNHLALAFDLGGNCPGALHTLDLRAAYAAENPGTYFLRAICHDRLRQRELAIENYERFLASNQEADSTQAFQARARLRLLKRQRGEQ